MSSPDGWQEAFPTVPKVYVDELFDAFSGQVEAWYAHDWEKVGLKAGKICEVAFSTISGFASGTYSDKPHKPSNFLSACQGLENSAVGIARSLRIQIPRILIGVYELRNNRSVGHVGSAVNPNVFDGEYFFRSSKWIICELSRALCEEKSVVADAGFYTAVNTSEVPIIWEEGDLIRVLRPDLSASEKTILVLAHYNSWIDVEKVRNFVEYKNKSAYKTRVLEKMHEKKLLEFSKSDGRILALPPGIKLARKLHGSM